MTIHNDKPVGRVSAKAIPLHATIQLPSSKSISNRVQIINALSYSPWPVKNLSDSDDTRVLAAALNSNDNVFDIGHAGTAMRFLTAFLSKIVGEWTITGSERMKQRPIGILVEALNSIGARVEYVDNPGFPPLRIFGSHLIGGEVELDGSISSQYLSALLMIAPTLDKGLTMTLKNRLTSRSYIEMTLKLMSYFGIRHEWKKNVIIVPPQDYLPRDYTVEADWSAASYWYSILALSPEGEIHLPGLVLSGLQGDEAINEWFSWFGIETRTTAEGISLLKKKDIAPPKLFLKFHETPDMAQTMAVLCVAKGVPFHFTGLETLKIKETNRISALQDELRKFGANLVEPRNGELKWDGIINPDLCIIDPVVETYHDHRMALAFAPMAIKYGDIRIADPAVISKSYPNFWGDLKHAGFDVDRL